MLSNELNNYAGKNVEMAGWIQTIRRHGKLIFIDLRDRCGITQLVILPNHKEANKIAEILRPEYVIRLNGIVNKRPDKMVNNNIASGKVEIEVAEIKILNECLTPPFEIDKDTKNVDEEVRMKYRYLDLRTERMQKNIVLRSEIMNFVRYTLHNNGFTEIETPYITKGTPEGSREYLVPSRLHAGEFYVLPQSPQQFKQLLMVSGIEKYFQIARCFRDEDERRDRQPEFTQIDMEMSFVTQDEVMQTVENLMIDLVKNITPNKNIQNIPFPKITHKEAIDKYHTDHVDLRKNKNDKNELSFCWVTDFPLFDYSKTEKKLVSSHHPFTMPNENDIKLLDTNPEKVRAIAYDLILNGDEIWGGSIRIHKRDLQNKIFKVLGLSQKEINERFGHMLNAFEYGCPPHGGIAAGFDRLVMILASEPNIREVIAFPKTGDARDLMMGAPSKLSPSILKENNIELSKNKHYKKY